MPSRATPDAPRLEAAAREPAAQTATDAEEEGGLPLRLVIRPGVLLTQRGLQLRPLIVHLGNDVAEYRALWDDQEQFKATIRPLLQRPCPLVTANADSAVSAATGARSFHPGGEYGSGSAPED